MGLNSYHIVGADVTQHSNFTFLLYGLPDGKLEATFDAHTLGQPPIGAASAVATKYWARVESEALAVFGAGWQAESQIEIEATYRIPPRLRRAPAGLKKRKAHSWNAHTSKLQSRHS